MPAERRNLTKRAEVFQRILRHVVENPAANFTFQAFQDLLAVPEAAARRILQVLVRAGLVAEVQRGVWARTWPNVCARQAHYSG